MKTVMMPRWVALCLALMTVSMSVFAVSGAIMQYTLIKPYVMDIAVVGSKLVVDSFILNYDPATNQYSNCAVQIRNTHTSDLTGTVYVYLYNGTQVNIASGQYSGTFSAGSVQTLTIPLTWISGMTVVNVTGGRAAVQQAQQQ